MTDKLVAVVWDDAHVSQVDSFTRDEIADRAAVTYTTFGLLVRDDEKVVAIAAEICADATYRGVTYVPRGMVREVIQLSCWPKRKRTVKLDAA